METLKMNNDTNETLKPCPFCGSEARLEFSYGVPQVHCSNDCFVGMMDFANPYCDQVMEKWNKRPISEEQRIKNEKALEAILKIKARLHSNYDGEATALEEEIELIKSALE